MNRLNLFSCASGLALACAKGPGEVGGVSAGGPPASSVAVVAMQTKRIEDSTDYLASLTSRRAVSLYPQISGYVRNIAVKPGSTVKVGAVLLQIDSATEQASMENLLASRESLAASLGFAKERQSRSKLLRSDGIVSQQDADQAQVQVDQAEASVRAADALIASQRARLSYFTIVAPFEGVVGNVPVKIGDFVNPATLLTSVTQDAGLEAEVAIPVERATALGPNSRIRLLDVEGQALSESPVVFISPRADPSTQLLLIKGAFEANPALRADQVVKARVIWSVADGLMVPTISVIRQAGQPFVYVVEAPDGGTGGHLQARRVPVILGAVQGGAYVVQKGLGVGQKVVTSGIQTIGDGSPVTVQPLAEK